MAEYKEGAEILRALEDARVPVVEDIRKKGHPVLFYRVAEKRLPHFDTVGVCIERRTEWPENSRMLLFASGEAKWYTMPELEDADPPFPIPPPLPVAHLNDTPAETVNTRDLCARGLHFWETRQGTDTLICGVCGRRDGRA